MRFRVRFRDGLAASFFASFAFFALCGSAAQAASVSVGSGSYSDELPAGQPEPQSRIFKTADLAGPMPTNDWWSSTAWTTHSERQFPHPLGLVNEPQGLRLYYPGPEISVPADDACICGIMPMGNKRDLVIGESGVPAFAETRVAAHSDWFVTNELRSGSKAMGVSYGHGSPYVYTTYEGGGAKISFEAVPQLFSGGADDAVLGVTINDGFDARHYGIFAPSGSTWQGLGTTTLSSELAGKDYLTVALLPDASQATLDRFARYAHNHPTDTRAGFAYDRETSSVRTDFEMSFSQKEPGPRGTIFALYPHQWRNSGDPLTPGSYRTVRGEMKLVEGEGFSTVMPFNGVLPTLPDLGDYDRQKLQHLIDDEEASAVPQPDDTYGTGKRLGRLATIAPIADQIGDHAAAETFRSEIKARLEDWLTASPAESRHLFYLNRNWGTLLGYDPSFGSVEELSDHHFHYGYYVKAAAEIARTDPEWARDWGPMLRLLIRDMASANRSDPDFPYLRNFDPYAGHSWASGRGEFGDGNNQESSSEAMNAWAGIILYAEAIGDPELRELGVYLYTTELNAIEEYWFDTTGENFDPAYDREVVTMVWGGKGANATWFSGAPERVHGINYLPITGASLYLGLDPAYAARNYADLVRVRGSTDWWHWEDLIWQYRALSDPEDAAFNFDRRLPAIQDSPPNGTGKGDEANEAGNSLATAYHWIHNLKVLGRVDASVTADTTQYAVFRKGSERTYVAYNPTDSEISVSFSDGHSIAVPPHAFNRGNGQVPPPPDPEPDPEPPPEPEPEPEPDPEPDPEAPKIEIRFPSPDDILKAGDEVGFYGYATDNVAVDRVEVSLQDPRNGLYYRADGTWGERQWQRAPLVDASGHWRWLHTPAANGRYELVARAVDGADKEAEARVTVQVGQAEQDSIELRGKSVRRTAKGTLRVSLHCRSSRSCPGLVKVEAGKRKVGRARYRLGAGRQGRVAIRARRHIGDRRLRVLIVPKRGPRIEASLSLR